MDGKVIALIEWYSTRASDIPKSCIIGVIDLWGVRRPSIFFLIMGCYFGLGGWRSRIPLKVEGVLVILGGLGGGFSFSTFEFGFFPKEMTVSFYYSMRTQNYFISNNGLHVHVFAKIYQEQPPIHWTLPHHN